MTPTFTQLTAERIARGIPPPTLPPDPSLLTRSLFLSILESIPLHDPRVGEAIAMFQVHGLSDLKEKEAPL